nr:PREDICTED: double-stranded RNA-binding protein 4-like [Daucus carota subsp. sativus]
MAENKTQQVAGGLPNMYKNLLQTYAQKRKLTLPAYSHEVVGGLYKSKVTVDGKSFETQEYFSTLKNAEQGAAKVAFESMSLQLTPEDEVLYKNLLQEHAQRTGLLPAYDIVKSGPPHMSIFVSTVEVGGKSYQGQEAKSKKMAEANAAKVAYICLTKCVVGDSADGFCVVGEGHGAGKVHGSKEGSH